MWDYVGFRQSNSVFFQWMASGYPPDSSNLIRRWHSWKTCVKLCSRPKSWGGLFLSGRGNVVSRKVESISLSNSHEIHKENYNFGWIPHQHSSTITSNKWNPFKQQRFMHPFALPPRSVFDFRNFWDLGVIAFLSHGAVPSMFYWLVVSTHLKSISQLGWLFPIYIYIHIYIYVKI